MSIEIGSKWVKDGEVVEVRAHCINDCLAARAQCIWFVNVKDKYFIHVLTERDFLERYKPYEPVYEYRYCFSNECLYDISSRYFTDKETKPSYWLKYQRLDFTKRERKQ